MFVLVNGKVYNSDDFPIMILFSQEEIRNFKSQPDNIDIHCSYPSKWGNEKGEKWMNSHTKIIVGERDKVYKKHPPIIVTPKTVISDDMIKELLVKESKSELTPIVVDFAAEREKK